MLARRKKRRPLSALKNRRTRPPSEPKAALQRVAMMTQLYPFPAAGRMPAPQPKVERSSRSQARHYAMWTMRSSRRRAGGRLPRRYPTLGGSGIASAAPAPPPAALREPHAGPPDRARRELGFGPRRARRAPPPPSRLPARLVRERHTGPRADAACGSQSSATVRWQCVRADGRVAYPRRACAPRCKSCALTGILLPLVLGFFAIPGWPRSGMGDDRRIAVEQPLGVFVQQHPQAVGAEDRPKRNMDQVDRAQHDSDDPRPGFE